MLPGIYSIQRVSIYSLFLIIALSHGCNISYANGLIEWQAGNIQLLRGWDYEVTDNGATLITLEYANQWKYGDFFAFTDLSRLDDGATNAYGEISPRFSFNKIFDLDNYYGNYDGIVSEYYLATNIEILEGGNRVYLAGLGLDLNLPGFTFFNVNLYNRHNPRLKDTWQLTLVWHYSFTVGNNAMIAEGFADFAGSAGKAFHSNQLIVPRLLFNIGPMLGVKKIRLTWELNIRFGVINSESKVYKKKYPSFNLNGSFKREA